MNHSPRLVLTLAAVTLACGPTAATDTTDATTTDAARSSTGSITSAGDSTDTSVLVSTTVPVTSTTASTTSEPTPTTADPTGGGFIIESDGGNKECDNWAQDCPEGQKCAAVIDDGGGAWNTTRCVPVGGTNIAGEVCTSQSVADGLDTCVKGAMCWDVDDMGEGTCVALCTGDEAAPICPNNSLCAFSGVINLCIPVCDPLLQDCFTAGDACYPVNDGFTCAPDASGMEGQADDPCGFLNVCDPGLACIKEAEVGPSCLAGSGGCCTPMCALAADTCEGANQQCVPLFVEGDLPPGDPNLAFGYCGVPP